jgi:hypothetical protein
MIFWKALLPYSRTSRTLFGTGERATDVFVTVDQNLEYQQNLAKLTIGIVVIAVPTNNIRYFRPIFPEILTAQCLFGRPSDPRYKRF